MAARADVVLLTEKVRLVFPEPVPVEGLIVIQVALVHTVHGQMLCVPIDSENAEVWLDTVVAPGSV